MLGSWAAFQIPPLDASMRAPRRHPTRTALPTPGCSLLCPSSLSLACLVDAKVGDCGTCAALQHQVNFAATKVLKERELSRSIRYAPACQASAYHACFDASSAHLTRSRLLIIVCLGGYPDGSHSVRAWPWPLCEPLRLLSSPQSGAFDGHDLVNCIHCLVCMHACSVEQIWCQCALCWLCSRF